MRPGVGVFLAALTLALPATADAALRVASVASGFNTPVQVVSPRSAPSGTLYVVEQPGRLVRWRNGSRTVVLDIRGRVGFSGGEEGLLSAAFNPNFAENRLFYVYFTNPSGNNEVEGYKMNSTGTRVVSGTRRDLVTINHPTFGNHNGGTLAFGRDNLLYLSTGDGGGGCDPGENAQDPTSRLGKILQIYGTRVRIVASGLRNPYRMSFDRLNGDLFIGDVGQDTWEEIDFVANGGLAAHPNFEWDVREGNHPSGCTTLGFKGSGPHRPPIHEYSGPNRETVIGGFVYRGGAIPEADGRYFFGDFLSGDVWSFIESGGVRTAFREEPFNVSQLVSFGEGPKGGLYLVSRSGTIYQLRAG